MTSGLPVSLVDTNVLVYAYDASESGKQARAIEVLARLGACPETRSHALASESQARQGRRERQYAGILARPRTPHRAGLQPPGRAGAFPDRPLERLGVGALSAQVLGEFFRTVTRKIPVPLTTDEAERSVGRYARTWPVHAVSVPAVLEAIRGVQRYRLSYWDGLIWATAKLNGVPTVLSEDFSDGLLLEGVRFVNPLAPAFDLASLG